MNSETRTVPAAALHCNVGPFELGDNGENAKTAPFRMVARTGDSIDHWYWGRVVHDLAGMRRHKASLPIDYIHNDGEVIGFANHFDITNGDLEVSGALVPFKDSDRATEIIHKAKNGVPYEASINFGGDGLKFEEYGDGDTVSVNGREFTGPVTVIRDWPLRGIAVCPYGADANTSTSFNSGASVEVIVMKKEQQLSEQAVVTEVEAVEVPAENDTTAEVAEVVAAVETEEVAVEETATGLTPSGPEFLEAFGERGGVWFAQGKSWEEAQQLHHQSLTDRIAELEGKLSALASQGEGSPVSFSSVEETTKPRGLAGKIQFAGSKSK
jgi:hypothetical protein